MKNLAKMAMLDVSDVENVWTDVEKMLERAEILKDIEPMDCLIKTDCVLRSDEAENFKCEGGYIVVPKVVGE